MEPFVNEENGKTAGIISYFWIIGWLVAYFGFHQNNKTSLGSYQLRQTLLFHIIIAVVWIAFDFFIGLIFVSGGFLAFYYLTNIFYLAMFVFWIIGLIGAINGQKKPMPLIGEKAQTMFPGI